MMRHVLTELYHGNITPATRQFQRGTPFDESMQMMTRNEEKLNAMLTGKEKETFEKFCACRDEVDQYTQEEAFIIGFRLGARILLESFDTDDGFFSEINA